MIFIRKKEEVRGKFGNEQCTGCNGCNGCNGCKSVGRGKKEEGIEKKELLTAKARRARRKREESN
ncbi:hypothetical protein IQ269_04450 [Tychonema sp. LEGE 07199]|uniref:hypothetical protein n=1 Tax=unclassified Tychonema TaxID=2642144 RepID=UPI00187F921A|nr:MULTISPECIES: hypothetical protein [unclassified Tychonema]MBE9120072.1 hypothetical protein [Tychonema sp. LEGE 07199]MBE9132846.1 hypothetical protein [Tychonema sp. LEGE 07196]